MADHSLESLFQKNKDGIRNKPCLEREMVEKLSRKHSSDLGWVAVAWLDFGVMTIFDHDNISCSSIVLLAQKPTHDIETL